jgi:hypothetical protein
MPAFGHSVGGQRYNASCPTPSTLAGLIFGRHASLCTRYGARSSLQSAAPKHEFHQPIQRDLGRPDAAAKINRFSFPQISSIYAHPASSKRGVRVVTIRGVRGAVDARRPRARGIAGRCQASCLRL